MNQAELVKHIRKIHQTLVNCPYCGAKPHILFDNKLCIPQKIECYKCKTYMERITWESLNSFHVRWNCEAVNMVEKKK